MYFVAGGCCSFYTYNFCTSLNFLPSEKWMDQFACNNIQDPEKIEGILKLMFRAVNTFFFS